MKHTKRLLSILLAVALLLSVMPMPALAAETNEDGYIEIYTIEDLYNVRNDLTANYILMNDIDLTAATTSGGDWDYGGRGWNPIGSNDVYGNSAFAGEFDGNGMKIIGMRIAVASVPSGTGTYKYLGLFANVTGSVHDLTFVGGRITSSAANCYIGTVAGTASGTISNVVSDTVISNTSSAMAIGGVVGKLTGTVEDCANHGSITHNYSDDAYDDVGGIVGELTGSVARCYNTGEIYGKNSYSSSGYYPYVGGIAGYVSGSSTKNATIIDCYNAASVTGLISGNVNTIYAGGIAGCAGSYTKIATCYNSGKTNDAAITNFTSSASNSTVSNSYYLTGTGNSVTGATVLTESQMLLQSIYAGLDFENSWVQNVDAVHPYPQLRSNPQDLRVLQGLALVSQPNKTVYAYGEALDPFGAEVTLAWDGGSETVPVTADMISGYDATTPGQQTVTVTYMGLTTIFTVEVQKKVFIPIYTVADLYNVRKDLTASYILMNDIDLTAATAAGGDWDYGGRGWNPIGSNDVYGNSAFTGEFDGNGMKIIGMRIDAASTPSGTGSNVYVGLFANVTGVVKNLSLSGGSISIRDGYKTHYAGAIAASVGASGVVENCKSTVEVYSSTGSGDNSYVGGIAGSNAGQILNCANLSSVQCVHSNYGGSSSTDERYAGGIAGFGTGTVQSCYNTGDVKVDLSAAKYGAGYAAGISYKSYNKDCYNTGNVYASSGAIANGIGGTASRCYNLGAASSSAISGNSASNSYYLAGTGSSCTGATSLTEGQLLLQDMYAGFDFENIWMQNPEAVYPYPQLRSNPQDLRVIQRLELVTLPDKTVYAYGEALDVTGCQIKLVLEGGEELVTVTEDMVTGYDTEKVGVQPLIVTYMGKTVTVNVTVNDKVYIPIYTIEELYNIRKNLSGNYILMNDIDLTAATAEGGDWDYGGRGWNPIGSEDTYAGSVFSGEFNGNGKKITGMRIDVTSGAGNPVYLGLFANVSGAVYDLTVTGSIYGHSSSSKVFYAGSIAGYCTGTITNCKSYVDLDVNSLDDAKRTTNGSHVFDWAQTVYVGGLAGYAKNSVFTGCSNLGTVKGKVGAAYMYSATQYSNRYTYSSVYAGGIAGYATATTIGATYNAGSISADGGHSYAAGIAYGVTAQNCYNAGAVQAPTAEFNNCSRSAYGIGGTATQCYNIGKITGLNAYAIGSTSSDSYYLFDTADMGAGATVLTETQMKTQTMYVGFDFENTWTLNVFVNHPYPQLRSNIQDMEESASLVSIISWPLKQEYFTGDELVLDGCMMNVRYVSGREELLSVTADMISGFDTNTPGEQTVTVSYRGGSDTFPVTVKARPVISDVELISQPNKTEFGIGTAFDFSGAQIKVSYESGESETLDVTLDLTTGGNIHHLGKQTITVTYYGVSVDFEVTVVPVSISSLRLEKAPAKLVYLEGEALDMTGMVLWAVMNNGTENPITVGYTVSGYDGTPGTQTVTLTYFGKTVSFDVTVQPRAVTSLVLRTAPTKNRYISGQEFDPSGMIIVATYDTGETVVVEDYTVSGFDANPGLKTVVVTYGGKFVAFPVTVVARVVTEFEIVSYPAKLEYLQYDAFDPTGLEVRATYNDGAVKTVTDYELVGFSSNPGTHTISVAYAGWVETFDVVVNPRVLTNIMVIAPTKLVYYLGEEFDDTGLKVTACFNNGQQIDVEDYVLSGFDTSSPGTKLLTVSYGGMTSKFSISVNERVGLETNGSFLVGSLVGRLGDEIRVPVKVTENSGLAGMKHKITYDATALSFSAIEMQDAYANGTLVTNDKNAESGEVTFVWFSEYDIAANGVVYEIVFEILETATDGNTAICLDYAENDNGNISGENVLFESTDGSVEIRSYWLGDLSGDRQVRVADLLHLAQYVAGIEQTLTDKQKLSADVNEDKTIDIHDVIMLQQWIMNAGVPNAQTLAMLSAVDDMIEDATKISLGEIKGKVGQEVVVPVTIENNVGISAFMFEVAYNTEDLTFVSAELGGVLDKGVLITQVDEENQRLIVLWYSTEGDVSADGEMLPLTFKINDTASGTYDLSVRYLAEDILNAARDEIICSIESGKILVGSVLTGNLTSLLVDGNNDVTLILSNGTEVVDELSISKGDYEFDSVAPGEYTLTVEKKNHATRTYTITVGDEDIALDVKLNLIGDIDGNGSVNMMDYLKAKQHSQGKNLLEDYAFDCADVSGDGKVNMMDYIKLKQHAQKIISIWE